jgi:hypothetical protein
VTTSATDQTDMPSTRILRTWRRQAQYVRDGFGLAIAAPARWRCSTPTLGPACPAARARRVPRRPPARCAC